jgi:ABC-type branched-subunit amino acid transport system substrate-binding protein
MARSTPLWRSLAVGGALALVLTACGGGDGDTEATEAPEATEAAGGSATGDGTLTIGTLLPETGSLAFLGPPEFAGVTLAVQEINEAGGVLGNDVVQIDGDSGDTSTNIAQQTVDTLLSQDVDGIVGAASSSVTLSVIDKITGAGVVQISPANTSTALSDYDDGGLYFRTAPSDVLQGRVLGDAVLLDGHQNVAIMALQDAYGETLAEQATQAIEDGGGTVVFSEFYDPKSTDFSALLDSVKSTSPDAIILIAFDETKTIIPQAVSRNIGPAEVPYFFVDGNLADYSEDFDPGTLLGVKGTLPGADTTDEFKGLLSEAYGEELTVFAYAAESYDATILMALAAIAAGDDSGEAIASQMQAVSRDGTKCTSFAECKELLEAGEDIDYDGVSGPIEFADNGDPTAAFIGIYEYDETNNNAPVDFIEGNI